MILPIYIYGQPVLRKVAEDITPDYPQLKDLISDMWETLAESEGIGLAAPQIGKPIRLSVIDFSVKYLSIPIFWSTMRSIPTPQKRDVCRCRLSMRRWCAQRVFMWSGMMRTSSTTMSG